MKRSLISMGLLPVILVLAGALQFETKKNAFKDIFEGYGEVRKRIITLTKDKASDLNGEFGGTHGTGEEFNVYYARNGVGEVDIFAITMREILYEHMSSYTWIFVFDGELNIQKAVILELSDERDFVMNSPLFLDQFKGRSVDECSIPETVDAVSGATLSSRLFIQSLKKAEYLIFSEEF